LLKSDISDEYKKATILDFDQVLGLDLKNEISKNEEIEIPEEVQKLLEERKKVREEKN
jgi:hypothetical protein